MIQLPEQNATSSEYLSGYLYKKTRDGRWQRRWFETNGVYLTYYKSRKMEKLLAALSLPQVGEIKLTPDPSEPEGEGLFSLELNSRIYILRAKTKDEATHWVTTLNKLRETGLSQQDQTRLSMNVDLVKSNNEDLGGWEKTGKFGRFCPCC